MLATQGEAARWIEQKAKVWLSERDTNTAHSSFWSRGATKVSSAAIFMRFRRQPDEAARRDAYDTAAGLTTTTKGTRHHGQDSTYHITSQ